VTLITPNWNGLDENGGNEMPTKLVLRTVAGTAHIKSQAELDQLFKRAAAAAQKARSADASHALSVYNKIVADGRNVKAFAKDPGATAEKLGLKLSASEVSQIRAVQGLGSGGAAADTVELVAVAIIVLVLAVVPDRELVVDTAGVIKV
jgi:hypothetical protein